MADDLPPRVAVLEQIARTSETALSDIRAELRGFRGEVAAQLREIRQAQRTDFRWLLGAMLGGFATLFGAHWL
jgi:hypothetical protein